MPLPHTLPPMGQQGGGFRGSFRALSGNRELHNPISAEPEQYRTEVLVHLIGVVTALQLPRVRLQYRLQMKVSFAEKDRPRHHAVDRTEESQRAMGELKRTHIVRQSKAVDYHRFPKSNIAELKIDRIRIREG